MTSDEIINYVMNTPENTNPNILKEMLNGMAGGGGSSQVFAVYCDNWGFNGGSFGTIDVSYSDLFAAMEAEKFCIICFNDDLMEVRAAIALLWGYEDRPTFTYNGADYYVNDSGNIYSLAS